MKATAAGLALLGLAALLPGLLGHAVSDKPAKQTPARHTEAKAAGPEDSGAPGKPTPWTMKEVMEQLAYHPRDAYLQYVALQLHRRNNQPEEVEKLLNLVLGQQAREGLDGPFDLFTGTLALQEQMQLEAMIGADLRHNARFNRRRQDARPNAQALMPENSGADDLTHGYKAGSLFLMSAASPALAGNLASSPVMMQMIADEALPAALVKAAEGVKKDKRRKELISVADLRTHHVNGLPWEKMLAGKNPEVSALSRCVPENFFLIEFRAPARMTEILNAADDWARYLISQAAFDARSHLAVQRLQKQLGLDALGVGGDPRLLDPLVDEIAVTGSDFFIQEGTDITVLIKHNQARLFQAAVATLEAGLRRANPQIQRSTGKIRNVDFTFLGTPDRAVHVFSADPRPDLHIRSNSRAALERVLDATAGKKADGTPVRRLGETAEYKYLRARMPRGAVEEDALFYFSEAFQRSLMGPQLKLAERRRLVCYNQLRMLGHATQMCRTETGKFPQSFKDLLKTECVPAEFTCPDGGKYTLKPGQAASTGQAAFCSHHGHAHALTPCLDRPIVKVNGEEAHLYREFTNQPTSSLVLPLAVRVQASARRYRVEAFTPAAPLDAWIPDFGGEKKSYQEAVALAFGKPKPLDSLPVPKGNLFTLNFKLNTETLFKDLDRRVRELEAWSAIHKNTPWLPDVANGLAAMPGTSFPASVPWCAALQYAEFVDGKNPRDMLTAALLEMPELRKVKLPELLARGLGDQIGVHAYDARIMMDMNWATLFQPSALESDTLTAVAAMAQGALVVPALLAPVYLSAPVRDARVVDDFLDHLDRELVTLVRHRQKLTRGMEMLPDFYKLTLKSGVQARALGVRVGPTRFRMFWARIGTGLYVTNHAPVLDDIQAAELSRGKAAAPADPGPEGHVMLRLRPENWKHALPAFKLGWAEVHREACYHNLGPLSSAARAFTAEPGAKSSVGQSWDERSRRACQFADGLHAVHHFCPDAGTYLLAKDGKSMACTIHGSTLAPRQPDAPAPNSTLDRALRDYAGFTGAMTFLPEGIRVVLTIDRK